METLSSDENEKPGRRVRAGEQQWIAETDGERVQQVRGLEHAAKVLEERDYGV
jgi:hypothetical protein